MTPLPPAPLTTEPGTSFLLRKPVLTPFPHAKCRHHLQRVQSQMGFFGYLGLLNSLFSIPILFGLVWGGFIDASGVTNRTVRRQL